MTDPPFPMPPLEWVRAFEATARCGSFTAAAREIGLTQSAISQRIGHLERRLGVTLFYRRARSIALTVEGEAWLPHVRAALDGLRDSSEALFGSGRGRLTISASQSIIELWLMPRLDALAALSRGQLSLQTMVLAAQDAVPEDVVRIRYGTGDWPRARTHRLFAERMAPVAAPGLCAHGGRWTELPRIAFAGPRPGWTARFGIPATPVPHLRFDTFAAALHAARAGMGVLLGSLPLCEVDLAAGRLTPLGCEVLEHHESYWAVAGLGTISRAHWDRIVSALK